MRAFGAIRRPFLLSYGLGILENFRRTFLTPSPVKRNFSCSRGCNPLKTNVFPLRSGLALPQRHYLVLSSLCPTLLRMANERTKAKLPNSPACAGEGFAASACHASETANVGENGVTDMTATTVDTTAADAAAALATALADTLASLVKADGKASTTAFDYMCNAMRSLVTADNAEEEAQSLIVAICDATGSRGKVTAEFPKGKANPNAIKANGYAMTAECARLIKKIGSTYADNEAVRDVVDGTLGLVRNEALFQQALDGDKRYVAAKADFDVADSGDDVEALDKAQAALNRAIAKVEADFLNSVYGDKRCHSFAELRRQLDKATASKAETTSDNADTADKGEGEGVDVSAAAAVIGADDMAQSLISRVADVSDDVLVALFDAVKADMERRCATEEERKAA